MSDPAPPAPPLDHRTLFVEVTPDADALCVTVACSPFSDEERRERRETEVAVETAFEAWQRGEPVTVPAGPKQANVRQAGTAYASAADVSRAYWLAMAEHATKRAR